MASYEIELSPKEFFALIFYKKKCPTCNDKMKRVKKSSLIKKGWDNNNGMYFYGKSYKVKIYYRCEKCNKDVMLSELFKYK